ncbi:MAG: iron donor protein CyaY [SAR324 cluster bacterium]|nr:iron donor protein CyaY [SAR324 cluster bacterium]
MENKEYLKQTNIAFKKVQDKLEDFEDEIDFDQTSDKLEILFEAGGPKIVMNTQKAIQELWLAGNGKGWHFKYQETKGIWFAEAEQIEFYQCLSHLIESRLHKTVKFG